MINEQLLNPKSIVVIGGSNDVHKPGGAVLRNLIEGNFSGALYVTNLKEPEVQGIRSFRDPAELPEVDLAIIAIAAKFIPETVEILANTKSTRAFIILSAGFSEESKEGKILEQKVVDIINCVHGVLIGPNCIGVLTPNYQGVFTKPIPKLDPKGCDFVSGSGATACFIMEAGIPRGITFSSVFSVGNSAQMGVEEVLKYLDEVKPDASLMGAVNTVVRAGDKLVGENTDGKGFIQALTQDAKVDPKGKKVLVLGAGGAARSITVELALAGAQQITIVNRSAERGMGLTELLQTKTPIKAAFIPWQGRYSIPNDTDILVNATSIGLAPLSHEKPEIDYESIRAGMLVCDVIPAPMTPFLIEAQKRGAKPIDGLGMLVYQGAIGFKLWTGLDAPVEAMYKALSKAFNL